MFLYKLNSIEKSTLIHVRTRVLFFRPEYTYVQPELFVEGSAGIWKQPAKRTKHKYALDLKDLMRFVLD